jgi:hypothetical protein
MGLIRLGGDPHSRIKPSTRLAPANAARPIVPPASASAPSSRSTIHLRAAGVALLACYLPARRVGRIDTVSLLKS